MTEPRRRRPEPEPDVEPDENVTRDDVEREGDRAADRYERALWRDNCAHTSSMRLRGQRVCADCGAPR
jgi:hypothetical protein